MWLSDAILRDVEAHGARVFYVTYAACRRWAETRDRGEPLVFSGWYWSLGAREAGPFRSQSAAWRDAWYRLGRRRAPLIMADNDLFEAARAVPVVKRRRGNGSAERVSA